MNVNNILTITLNGLLVLFAVLGIIMVIFNKPIENFTNGNHLEVSSYDPAVKAGMFPSEVTFPLLKDIYPVSKKTQHLSINNSEKNYSYSNNSTANYKQETNNKRHWNTPCNGWTTPASVCGGLYEKILPMPKNITPPRCCIRVNYYCSH